MKTINNQTPKASNSTWVDVIWYLSDQKYFNTDQLIKLLEANSSIIIASNKPRPADLTLNVIWHQYKKSESRSEIWNSCLELGSNNWKLFLMDDEILRINKLDEGISTNPYEWPAALIHHRGSEKNYQYYQMRLICNFTEFRFDGVNIPDATRSMIQKGIRLSNVPLEIMATKNPNADVDIEEELAIRNFAPQLFIENGHRLFKEKKFIHAAAQYRVIVNSDIALPFDRLSALNGIATCHAEQFRWEPALEAADRSLEEETFQHLPYLIKYKVNQLNKNYSEAYNALLKYYENTFYEKIKLHSRANYDVRITIEDTLVSLVDLAFKSGLIQDASDHLEDLFNLKEGNLEKAYLKQLLVLSIELEDFEKSEFFFKKLYAKKFPKNMTDNELSLLNDYMEMFMKRKWFESVYEVYSELYYHYPQNDEFRRRLIVTLVKTGRLEQARNLASKVA